jgi:hypothetical protein
MAVFRAGPLWERDFAGFLRDYRGVAGEPVRFFLQTPDLSDVLLGWVMLVCSVPEMG